jgi:DNA-binding FrmR family transcriptional regulator
MVNKDQKQQIDIALKKAKTSIERIQKMMNEDSYCIDVLQQILAVQGLLKSSSEKILTSHLHTCFAEGMSTKDSDKKDKLIKELTQVMKMNSKS